MYTKKVYQEIASLLQARNNCLKSNNQEWFEKHTDRIHEIANNVLPHGSGFDSGCKVDLDKSTCNRIIINTSFHHMDENGYYCGWTDHKIIITPSLQFGCDIRITGRDYNDWKEYAYQEFEYRLNQSIGYNANGKMEVS